MITLIRSHHITLTSALKKHAENKLQNPVARIVKVEGSKLRIEIYRLGRPKSRTNKVCHVTLSLPNSRPINISVVDMDMYRAIDLVHHRLLRQVKRRCGQARGQRASIRWNSRGRPMGPRAA